MSFPTLPYADKLILQGEFGDSWQILLPELSPDNSLRGLHWLLWIKILDLEITRGLFAPLVFYKNSKNQADSIKLTEQMQWDTTTCFKEDGGGWAQLI